MKKLLKLELSGITHRRGLLIFLAGLVVISTLSWWSVRPVRSMEYNVIRGSLSAAERYDWDVSDSNNIPLTEEDIRKALVFDADYQVPSVFGIIPMAFLTLFVSVYICSVGFKRKAVDIPSYPEYPVWKVFAARLLIFYSLAFAVLTASILYTIFSKFMYKGAPILPRHLLRHLFIWLYLGIAAIGVAFLIASIFKKVWVIGLVTFGVFLIRICTDDFSYLFTSAPTLPVGGLFTLVIFSAAVTLICTAASYLFYRRAAERSYGAAQP